MNNEVEFKEQLIKIQESSVMRIQNWWGLRYSGYKGIIVNENKELYRYQFYNNVPPELKEHNVNYITKIKDLTSDEYEMIIKFIENEIIDKKFDNYRIFDAGYDLYINYNGINIKIINNKGFDNNLLIYDKAEKLLKEIIGKDYIY